MKKRISSILACLLALALPCAALAEGERVAVIYDPADAVQAQVAEKAAALREVYGYSLTVLECSGDDQWSSRFALAAEEECDLVIGVGPQAARPAAEQAAAHHERTAFAVIDGDAGSEFACSYRFRDDQSACLVGLLAATALPDAAVFGYIGKSPENDAGALAGFSAGVRSVSPDAQILEAWVTGDDEAREQALALREAGCGFLLAAEGFEGAFAAALEAAKQGAPLYIAGRGDDATREDNPWILTAQLKNAGVIASVVIDNFYAGTLEGGLTVLDLASGAIGASHVTSAGDWRNEAVLTDDVLAACRDAIDRILAGEIEGVPGSAQN